MSFCLIILQEVIAIDLVLILANLTKIASKSLIEINVNKARKLKQIKKIVIVYTLKTQSGQIT